MSNCVLKILINSAYWGLKYQKIIGTTPASAACEYGIQRKFSLKNAVLKHVIRFAVRMGHG